MLIYEAKVGFFHPFPKNHIKLSLSNTFTTNFNLQRSSAFRAGNGWFRTGKTVQSAAENTVFVLCFSTFELSLPTNHFIKKRHPLI